MNNKALKFALLGLLIITAFVAVFWFARVNRFSIDRNVVTTAFDLAINDIANHEPTSGSRWNVQEFRFVNDKGFYIEYSDGRSIKVMVVKVSPKFPFGADYDFVGELEPSSEGFVLASGTDPFAGESFDIYRRNSETGEWERVITN